MNKTEKDKLEKILNAYLKEIHKTYTKGEFREESFYPFLKSLFENCSGFFSMEDNVNVLVSPKKTEVGFPDVLIRRDGEIIGRIEAKLPSASLEDVETSEQLKRYIEGFPNFILTNFLQFRWYRDAELISDVEICNQEALQDLKPPVPENMDSFFKLVDDFYCFSIPEMKSASELAVVLAKKTRFSKYILEGVFEREEKGVDLPLITGFYKVFQETLIGSLTKERFVDLYAQTITYGLFAAKMMAKEEEIDKDGAWRFIPGKVPLLKDVFYSFGGPNTPESLTGPVDEIVKVLNKTDISAIYEESFRQKKDPVIHFYETFLKAYNPEERERLGVYYTPIPVVSYIVSSIHILLKRKFKKTKGLAEGDVTLLDPAAGTLTFIIRAIREALSELKESHSGLVPLQIENHILPNYFAFELLIVPYIIGHLRAAMVLEREFDYKLKENERFRFYLTNSLEMREPKQALLLPELTEEGKEAKRVKEEVSILVVLGNPPYSVSSENKSDFIENLMEDYKKDVRKEKNIQPLSDDYIKFIRFAHWKIDQTGKGIVGFISNNSYLSGVIHRGMRKELLETFDEIYILNLHGSSRIGEKTSEGGKDENVFDIQQGVAIAIYVKLEKPLKKKKIYYADVWGLRDVKYKYLRRNDVTSTDWRKLDVNKFEELFRKTRWSKKYKTGFYFFTPKSVQALITYGNFWGVDEIFGEWSFGVTTSRDHFVVGFTKEEIVQRLKVFVGDLSDELVKERLKLKDTGTWRLNEARQKMQGLKLEDKIYSYAYRPYDIRWICYEPSLIERDRRDVMQHILNRKNLGLTLTRRLRDPIWRHVYATSFVTDKTLLSSRDNCYFFPLYLYSDESTVKLLDEKASKPERTPNFTTEFLQAIKEALDTEPTPEEIFYYIYAVLYSPTYRKRYEEFLKIDFPRIPLPENYEKFKKLSELGKELVELHLLKRPALQEIDREIGFPKSGSNKVEKVKYDEETKRVYFNKEQYFEGISKDAWEYQIGGYQVMEKYLKDRRKEGRKLSEEEIKHYMRVAKVIERTIEVQGRIDGAMGRLWMRGDRGGFGGGDFECVQGAEDLLTLD